MEISKDLQKNIDRVTKEKIEVVEYDPRWSEMFEEEKRFLLEEWPEIIRRVEHFGSSAIPGMSAKPVVDMLIEVSGYDDVRKRIVPELETRGYDYFWRPEFDRPPMYTFFIKRDKNSKRTHHLHMVVKNSQLWERIAFRDYLIEHQDVAQKYIELKNKLMSEYQYDRVKYTQEKSEFVQKVTQKALASLRT